MALAVAVAAPAGLERALRQAIRRARTRGEALVAVTLPAPGIDPAEVMFASRRRGEPFYVFEQPDRDRHALAALGCVRALEASGPDRFARVSEEWRALAGGAVADDGLVAVGGVAFAPDRGRAQHWQGFAPPSPPLPPGAPPPPRGEG